MRRAGLITLAFCSFLTACASLPENYEREQTWKLDGGESGIAVALEPGLAEHPGLSGAYPLGTGIEALAARVVLARAAEQSLDIQYYIWHGDTAGKLLLKELLDAADRGVRIRLLLDDLGVGAEDDEAFLVLDAYPHVSVNLFNPIALRGARKAGLIADPGRLNHRMHNKSMTADNQLTVVGGRNIGDEYFSLNELVNFADMDVIAMGPVVDQVSDSFDLFWNSSASIPIGAFQQETPSEEQLARARNRLNSYVADLADPYYQAMRSAPFHIGLQPYDVDPYWARITALFDQPEKALGDESALLLNQLVNLLGGAQEDLLIISPYFVPGKKGTAALVAAVAQGVRVRIFTNSLAATDVAAVHAGYKKYRRKLLEGGVEIFELMPQVNTDQATKKKLAFSGSSNASLHAKMYIFDRQQVFIGSMNLDPRSVAINTEIGLLIDSAALATDLESRLEKGHEAAFYSVVLEPRNKDRPGSSKRLVWIEVKNGKEIRYTTEPHTSSWQRFKVGLIGLLPVESQL